MFIIDSVSNSGCILLNDDESVNNDLARMGMEAVVA
jgi:hypothetical protein